MNKKDACSKCGFYEHRCICDANSINLSDFEPLEPRDPPKKEKPVLKIVSSQETPEVPTDPADGPAMVALKAAASELAQKMDHANEKALEHAQLAQKYVADYKGWQKDLVDVVHAIARLSEVTKSEQLLP